MESRSTRKITRLTFKQEGEYEDGRLYGSLTDQAGSRIVDGWVAKTEALRIARDLGGELIDY